ncbi:NAD-dependent succinate-semialdehyde dehydrogenase [Oceanisphaera arctica]|uniref:Succinate-semialdehyde dehydrogenase (NADP(+)) n=1 Tax=Oceanisphaera arctica TaxID=641510 RepID=A0A2P5TQA8_9GAMM|nr:NAD-dependent succinate-semialdehyde dehydrogenase [Oceanisphaera arctica]PPL17914.1 succinate-semialdehyde dehydrogenase (NADP(+)) [Oceanisphaera arctica]GHA23986.1 NAD-dependent succinate-semialdehyde dehydrogenase [Oceanisphaera arctica]
MSMNSVNSKLVKDAGYINGHWCQADSGATIAVYNPATGEQLGQVPDMGILETSAAIDAASTALLSWRDVAPKERARLLRCWFDLIIEHKEDLALLMTLEQGKPLFETRGEVMYGASYIEWYAEEGKRAYGKVFAAPTADKRALSIQQPIGVVAAITPWNFPNAMITRKIAPALAAGCTVVVKPSEETPFSALALMELAEQAGIPAGVINMITSSQAAAVGKTLTDDSRVRKLSFTGSTRVGKLLYGQSADTVKKLSLELGGNAPFIVFDDADLDAAVAGAVISKFRNAGQTCVCANRILVQDGIHDAFVARFKEAVEQLVVGNGLNDATTLGPVINKAAIDKIAGMVDKAQSEGASLVTGGQRHEAGELFFAPTILTGVTQQMEIARQEIFGPVAPVIRFKDDAEAIAIANDTPYGLAAYFFTESHSRIWKVAESLEYGMIGINEGILSNEIAPFGGVKESGLGREGSSQGLEDYMETKYLCMGGIR